MLTKQMLETAIFEHGEKDYITVKETDGKLIMGIEYETPDCQIFQTISDILEDVDVAIDTEPGEVSSGMVDFSEKGVIRITFDTGAITFYEPIEKISVSARNNALQVLVDNGIEEDEAETVLQAVGYVLLDRELFPENIAI